jgi:hypothetical protein
VNPNTEVTTAHAVQALGEIQAEMKTLSTAVRDLDASNRRNKRLSRIAAGLTLIDLVMSVLLGLLYLKAEDNANRITKSEDFIAALCEQTNGQNAKELTLWERVFAEQPTNDPDRTKQVETFREFVHDLYASKEC